MNPVTGVTCKYDTWIKSILLSKYKVFCCIKICNRIKIETSLTGEESSSHSSSETGDVQRDCVDQQASMRRREAGLPVHQEIVEARRRDCTPDQASSMRMEVETLVHQEIEETNRSEMGPLVDSQEIVKTRRRDGVDQAGHQEIVESRRGVQAQEGNSIGESEGMYRRLSLSLSWSS